MTTVAAQVLLAPFVLSMLVGFAVACIALRPRHRRPAPPDDANTTYWYRGQQVNADEWHLIRSHFASTGEPVPPTVHRIVVHPSHIARDTNRVPWSCTCGTGSGIGGSRADAMGQHAAHTERTSA